jgi:hypothetical protein
MAATLVIKVPTECRAEAGDLYADPLTVRRCQAPPSANVSALVHSYVSASWILKELSPMGLKDATHLSRLAAMMCDEIISILKAGQQPT